ncbi:hypothetical protein EON64_07055 [archaeon]|nr:MAG: hypothetical protein EON64_07055 [archaeon]
MAMDMLIVYEYGVCGFHEMYVCICVWVMLAYPHPHLFSPLCISPPIDGHVTFNVTVRPKLSGMYESTRGRIKYVNPLEEAEGGEGEGEGGVRMGYSTSLGRVRIVTEQEFQRSVSYFVTEWGVYALLALLPVLLPFTAYRQTRGRMEAHGGQAGGRGKRNA